MVKRFLVSLLAVGLLSNSLAQDAAWSTWGEWSVCSRTCGGGVTKQQRVCTSNTNGLVTESCNGEKVHYQLCNIQDCPVDSVDFRTHQCSLYDTVPYKGSYFKWASFQQGAGECELKCMPKGKFFFVTFKKEVIDGTRCNPHTLDTCVNAKCEPVGCDMQLYSNAKIDMCGICNGRNDTCRFISNEFRFAEDAYGYVDVVTIPSGATNIKIYETGATANFIALSRSQKAVLNNDYVFTHSLTQKLDSGTLRYERNEKTNHVYISGPTDLPIKFSAFAMSPGGAAMKYEYFVPNSFSGNADKKAEYNWITEEWGECSKSCAGGTRSRGVHCVNSQTQEKVEIFNCGKLKKPSKTDNCNAQNCPSRWYISQWAPCSVSCGRGKKTRRVHCLETLNDGNDKMLDLKECAGEIPHNVEDCIEQEKCPEWLPMKWSPCSKTCGDGTETRTIHCMDMTSENSVEESKCSIEEKPVAIRKCFNVPCGSKWETQEWGECSANCGRGIKSRTVICRSADGFEVPSSYCDPNEEPTSFEDCDATGGPCKPEWHAAEWSKCTARCSYGNQIRVVVCAGKANDKDSTLNVVKDDLCNPAKKPIHIRRCISEKPCHVNYFVGKWSKCSSTCGTGFQLRHVKCYADRELDLTQEACSKLAKPASVKLCKTQTCEGEELKTNPTTATIRTTAAIPNPTTTQVVRSKEAAVIDVKGNVELHEGDNADFECVAKGYPQPQIEWTLNGKVVTESTRFSTVDLKHGSRLVILATILADAGRLTCTAKNHFSYDSKTINLLVSAFPKIEVVPATSSKEVGDHYKIECKASGLPAPRIQWTKDGFSFLGDYKRVIVTNRGITFKNLVESDTGTYRCMGFNSAGTDYASSLLAVARKISNKDCYDQNSKADCLTIVKVQLCRIRYYQDLCCASCSQARR